MSQRIHGKTTSWNCEDAIRIHRHTCIIISITTLIKISPKQYEHQIQKQARHIISNYLWYSLHHDRLHSLQYILATPLHHGVLVAIRALFLLSYTQGLSVFAKRSRGHLKPHRQSLGKFMYANNHTHDVSEDTSTSCPLSEFCGKLYANRYLKLWLPSSG